MAKQTVPCPRDFLLPHTPGSKPAAMVRSTNFFLNPYLSYNSTNTAMQWTVFRPRVHRADAPFKLATPEIHRRHRRDTNQVCLKQTAKRQRHQDQRSSSECVPQKAQLLCQTVCQALTLVHQVCTPIFKRWDHMFLALSVCHVVVCCVPLPNCCRSCVNCVSCVNSTQCIMSSSWTISRALLGTPCAKRKSISISASICIHSFKFVHQLCILSVGRRYRLHSRNVLEGMPQGEPDFLLLSLCDIGRRLRLGYVKQQVGRAMPFHTVHCFTVSAV